jgi:hypothetical protein
MSGLGTNNEKSRIVSDYEYWTEWGGALGLRLRGFSRRDSAQFEDIFSGEWIGVGLGDGFRFLDRIRTELLAKKEVANESNEGPVG